METSDIIRHLESEDLFSSVFGFNEFVNLCHGNAVAGGWWSNPETSEKIERNVGELLMLMISELVEARDGINIDDDKLPHRNSFEVEIADYLIRFADFLGGTKYIIKVKQKFELYVLSNIAKIPHNEQELIDRLISETVYLMEAIRKNKTEEIEKIIIGIFHIIKFFHLSNNKYEIFQAAQEKIEFNKHREDHKIENRRKSGGKKF